MYICVYVLVYVLYLLVAYSTYIVNKDEYKIGAIHFIDFGKKLSVVVPPI